MYLDFPYSGFRMEHIRLLEVGVAYGFCSAGSGVAKGLITR